MWTFPTASNTLSNCVVQMSAQQGDVENDPSYLLQRRFDNQHFLRKQAGYAFELQLSSDQENWCFCQVTLSINECSFNTSKKQKMSDVSSEDNYFLLTILYTF